MKKTKIIIPALGMLLLSTAASISGTVAWFSMNNKVTVTGMSVTTKVSSSILISETNANAASYSDSLEQVRSGVLEPASTVNGINYFYTVNALANGDAKTEAYKPYSEVLIENGDNPLTDGEPETNWTNALSNTSAGKTTYDALFNSAYGFSGADASNVAYAYMDYTFYLKATNTDAGNRELRMTRCYLEYAGQAVAEKAWRVAVFVQDAQEYTALNTAVVAGDRKEMLSLDGAANFTTGKAIATESTLDTVTYSAAALKSVAAGATVYEKVTVRLWLEGEDTTCNNQTFAALTSAYTLALDFSIDGQTASAANITTHA